jgi:K+-sensing histidine kinase KdpD
MTWRIMEIRIRDNATGIPPEVKEKMFNPFFTTKQNQLGAIQARSRSFNRGIGAAATRTLTGYHPHTRLEWANTPGDGGGTRIRLGRHHL